MGPSCVAQICSTAASSSVFFASHPQPQSMKIAAFALLVTNVASTSLLKDWSDDATLGDMATTLNAACHQGDFKELCDKSLQDLFKHDAAAAFCDSHCPQAQQWWEHRALLARGRPHQSFLQNDLEGVTKGDR